MKNEYGKLRKCMSLNSSTLKLLNFNLNLNLNFYNTKEAGMNNEYRTRNVE